MSLEQHGAQSCPESDDSTSTDFVTLFSGKFAQAIDLVPDELRRCSEEELHEKAHPSPNDWKLRQNFSDAVKEARLLGQDKIFAQRIYEGVITRQTFHNLIIPNPCKIAWIIRPLIEHTDYYNAIHKLALTKIFKMVENMPLDAKYLPQLLKIAETAGNRVHGPVVQRMHIQSKNLNVEVDAKHLAPSENQEDLTKRIEAMQAKLIEAPRDVTAPDEN